MEAEKRAGFVALGEVESESRTFSSSKRRLRRLEGLSVFHQAKKRGRRLQGSDP